MGLVSIGYSCVKGTGFDCEGEAGNDTSPLGNVGFFAFFCVVRMRILCVAAAVCVCRIIATAPTPIKIPCGDLILRGVCLTLKDFSRNTYTNNKYLVPGSLFSIICSITPPPQYLSLVLCVLSLSASAAAVVLLVFFFLV